MRVSTRKWAIVPVALAAAGAAAVALLLALGSADSPAASAANGGHSRGLTIDRTESAVAFRNDMRKLWEDHITWTRLFIVSFGADLPDLSATTGRLLQNQTDIGDAVKPFYGEAAGDQLTALLREHILIAADLVAAAKSGDTAAFNDANARWYANAEEIAQFLHDANPENWPLQEMSDMMRIHLDLTLQEASAHLTGDFAASIAAYEQVHQQILGMADMLSIGIIHQFPHDFAPNA